MLQDSNAIVTLCSYVCVGEGVRPLEPREYSDLTQLLHQVGKTPKDLFGFSAEDFRTILGFDTERTQRFMRLLDRNASLSFELGQYQNMGIEVITRADAGYPKKLKKKLVNQCPPLFYYAGDLSLLDRKLIGYVGSRTITQEDLDFTVQAVRKTTDLGYGVVSGGAKGIDTVSGTEALLRGGVSVEYLSDSMLRKLKNRDVIKNIQQGKLLLLSVSKPDTGFNVGMAMMRNRYIYAQSVGTVIIRSDFNKGGTWTGANDNLKNNWCTTLCWDHPYPGNQALIENGAIPIDENWDGGLPDEMSKEMTSETYEQTSLFGMD
ncbi:MAG: DNA-protecting protein DprA [Bacteroidaceae bacterium]|nr:DNA-protecting protein DprA [Bacteroidaceae bacterium]